MLEFGRYRDITAYILVANMLTRRIYTQYQERTEKAMAEGRHRPSPLVITIEEAHKFLNPEVASQTIFGTIAREMRKYNVTLLVIDQRPSGIDDEVMSQLGTKITCLLDNEKDIDSVLAGVSGKNELKSRAGPAGARSSRRSSSATPCPCRWLSSPASTAPPSPTGNSGRPATPMSGSGTRRISTTCLGKSDQ